MSISGKFPSDQAPYTIKALATKHADFMSTPKVQRGNPFRSFVEKVMSDLVGIPFDDLKRRFMGDFNMLLVDLYRATHGNVIDFKVECPNCGFRDERRMVDLSKADVKILGEEDPCENIPFTFQGQQITWRLITIEDQMLALEESQEYASRCNEEASFMMTVNLSAFVQTVSGVSDPNEEVQRRMIQKWVTEAPMSFADQFQTAIEEFSIGPDLSVDVTCTKCEEEFFEDIPLLQAFFTQGRMARQRKRTRKSAPREVQFSIRSEPSSLSIP